jgi:hypothetical protein
VGPDLPTGWFPGNCLKMWLSPAVVERVILRKVDWTSRPCEWPPRSADVTPISMSCGDI